MTPFRRTRRTATAVGVVALVLVCQGAAWVHAAATPHVTCLEHGESVHLNVAATVVVSAPAGLTLAASPTTPVTHGHEHCAAQGPRATSSSSARRGTSSLVAAPPLAGVRHVPPPTLPLLCFAPKTSPPRSPVV